MITVTLSFDEAVALAAKQNYEYDWWNDSEGMDSWEKMKEIYIEEAKVLFNDGEASYLPDENYNKAHPGKEHVHIILKNRSITLTFKTKLMMTVGGNISDEEIIKSVNSGYTYAEDGSTLSLPGDIKEEVTYEHKIEGGFNYSKDDN